jgi:Na+/H+-dicarboxylate symporter
MLFLQMTVLPYVALSLTANVGRLSTGQGGRLARIATYVLLVLWVIGLLMTGVMSFSFPPWKAGPFFSASLVEEPESLNWLELFIPSNPFWSLAWSLFPSPPGSMG